MDERAGQEALMRLVRRLGSHSVLSSSERDTILALPGEIRSVKARSDFIHAREAVDHACLIVSGLVGRYVQLEDGFRQIVSIHLSGDLVDIYSLLLPRSPMSLVALSAAVIMRIPHTALSNLIKAEPDIGMVLWRDTIIDANAVAQNTVNVGRRSARERIAHLVCEMAIRLERVGQLSVASFAFPLTQEQLGDMLALTSVHVNRTLKALREDGVMRVASGQVDILDWGALQHAAGFDGHYMGLTKVPAGPFQKMGLAR